MAHWNPNSHSDLIGEESPDNRMQGTERKFRVERPGILQSKD